MTGRSWAPADPPPSPMTWKPFDFPFIGGFLLVGLLIVEWVRRGNR